MAISVLTLVNDDHIAGLHPLLALHDPELHFIAFIQRTITRTANGLEMYENILIAGLASYKAEALYMVVLQLSNADSNRPKGSLQVVVRIPHLYNGLQLFGMTTKGPVSSWCSFRRNAGRRIRGDANASSHIGDCSSGIGFAWNSFLHCLAVHRAQVLDFFLRALSVEIPVPAYICR